jgi:hypothetical protein
VGYLFLMIDSRDGKDMQIHVRTWQPEKWINAHLCEQIGTDKFEVKDSVK